MAWVILSLCCTCTYSGPAPNLKLFFFETLKFCFAFVFLLILFILVFHGSYTIPNSLGELNWLILFIHIIIPVLSANILIHPVLCFGFTFTQPCIFLLQICMSYCGTVMTKTLNKQLKWRKDYFSSWFWGLIWINWFGTKVR